MVPTNVLHAVAGRLHQFLFCSFPEYSAGYNSAQHLVGADVHIGPFVRFHRNYPCCGNAATVPPAAYFFCCARKSRQKDALENDLWRLRADSFQRPDGRRIATIPMAFGADKCTTRSYRQAESIPVLLISGILDRRADVGIGPYKHIRNPVRADRVVRPHKDLQ